MATPKYSSTPLGRNQSRSYAEAIFDVASDVFTSGKPADRILSAYFRNNKRFGSRDRRAIMETLYSTFRWWGWLSLLLPKKSLAARQKITEKTWAKLLVAAHALDNSDLPPYALGWKQTAGLQEHVPMMDEMSLTDKAKAFTSTFGTAPVTPELLVPKWALLEAGLSDEDGLRLVESFCNRAPMWIRIQRDDIQAVLRLLRGENLEPELLKKGLNAVNLGNPRINLYQLESFKKGQYEVQDLASQFVGLACAPQPGQRWWDACAGAGGKTLQLASLMKNKGTVVASDIREYKLKDLKKRARRAGFSNISPKPWPSNKIPVKAASFDGVLVDAPCSCSGTWRRNPDARWTSPADSADKLAPIQLDILKRAAKAVSPGGVLVYATCSFCAKENAETVTAFLEAFPNFALDPFPHPVTGETVTSGMLQTMPWTYDSDAMFVARMRLTS